MKVSAFESEIWASSLYEGGERERVREKVVPMLKSTLYNMLVSICDAYIWCVQHLINRIVCSAETTQFQFNGKYYNTYSVKWKCAGRTHIRVDPTLWCYGWVYSLSTKVANSSPILEKKTAAYECEYKCAQSWWWAFIQSKLKYSVHSELWKRFFI